MYTSAVATAKVIRPILKQQFPGVKFSVNAKGGSVNIHWTDFPSDAAVRAIVDQYQDVSRDNYSGEILSGGNLFIFAGNEFSAEMRAELEAELPEGVQRDHYEYWRYMQEIADKKYLETLGLQSSNGRRARDMIERYFLVEHLKKDESLEIGSYSVQRIDGGYDLEYLGHRFCYADAKKMIQDIYDGMHNDVEPILTPEQQRAIAEQEDALDVDQPAKTAEVISFAERKAKKIGDNLTPVDRLMMVQLADYLSPEEMAKLIAAGQTVSNLYSALADALESGRALADRSGDWVKRE